MCQYTDLRDKEWITLRRFAHISTSNRAAAEKLVLARILVCNVATPLFSKWSASCGAFYPATKRPNRVRVLAIGGDDEGTRRTGGRSDRHYRSGKRDGRDELRQQDEQKERDTQKKRGEWRKRVK